MGGRTNTLLITVVAMMGILLLSLLEPSVSAKPQSVEPVVPQTTPLPCRQPPAPKVEVDPVLSPTNLQEQDLIMRANNGMITVVKVTGGSGNVERPLIPAVKEARVMVPLQMNSTNSLQIAATVFIPQGPACSHTYIVYIANDKAGAPLQIVQGAERVNPITQLRPMVWLPLTTR